MKIAMSLLALMFALPASAETVLSKVQVRDGNSVSEAELVVESVIKGESFSDDNGTANSINRIAEPRLRLSGLRRDILIEGHDQNTTNVLCGQLEPSKAFGGVGQIGVLDQTSLFKFSHASVAVLTVENETLIATLKPAKQSSGYVHSHVFCADHLIPSGGE